MGDGLAYTPESKKSKAIQESGNGRERHSGETRNTKPRKIDKSNLDEVDLISDMRVLRVREKGLRT